MGKKRGKEGRKKRGEIRKGGKKGERWNMTIKEEAKHDKYGKEKAKVGEEEWRERKGVRMRGRKR